MYEKQLQAMPYFFDRLCYIICAKLTCSSYNSLDEPGPRNRKLQGYEKGQGKNSQKVEGHQFSQEDSKSSHVAVDLSKMYSYSEKEKEREKAFKKHLTICKHSTFLHCLVAAKTTRCNLSTRFSEIEEDLSVSRGVTLLAPSS